MKIFRGTAEQEQLVIRLLREQGDVKAELLVERGLSADDADTAVELVHWGLARAVSGGVRVISSNGGSDPIFRAARELGRWRLGSGRFDRFWLVAFSALAALAPVLGLHILQDCLRPTGGPPSTLVGDAKRAFLLEVLDTALWRTALLTLALLTPALLSHWRLRLGPKASRARLVAKASVLVTSASLATWLLLARAALLRQ